jgi:spore germination protein YaaH
MSHNSSINQIFFDHRNRRWKYFLLLIFLLSAFLILFFASAVTSVVFSPDLPDIKLPPLPEKNSEILNFLGTSGSSGKTAPLEFNTASAQSSSLTPGDKPKILAFYVNWDDGSLISLERNANEIGILSPEWLHLKNEQGELELDDPGQQKKVRDFIEKNNPGMQIYPLVNNYDPAADRWNGEILAKIFATENSREQSVNSLLGYLSENNDAGIVIDFENMRPADQTGFILYLKHLYSVLHPRGIKVLVTVPLADTDYQTKLIGQYCDEIILLALDENVPGVSLAGPISSRDWYEKNFSARLREMPENKYIISLGGYGYDWQGDTTAGMPVSFIEALQKAKDYKKEINIESKSLNPFF